MAGCKSGLKRESFGLLRKIPLVPKMREMGQFWTQNQSILTRI